MAFACCSDPSEVAAPKKAVTTPAVTLFTPGKVGDIEVQNRIFMAPLTRSRATIRTHVPTPLMAEHYAQRATGGLLITEATMVADNQSGFVSEPGLYSDAQVQGWKVVTSAVHAQGGKIVCQIVHCGRAAHPINGNDEDITKNPVPVAPSAIGLTQHQCASTPTGEKIPYVAPRALEEDEIPSIIKMFVTAAQNAVAAGFDGVEVHGANGYLIDEFLRSSANKREGGRYSGASIQTRAQFLLDVVDGVGAVIGFGRVGVRISPLNSYNEMADTDPEGLTRYVATQLAARKIAYLHVMRADFFGVQKGDAATWARESFPGPLVLNMGYTADEGTAVLAAGKADAIAYGTQFLANPDLPARFAKKAELNAPNPATFYTGGAAGYTDYPAMTA